MKRNHIRIMSAFVLVFAAFLWGCGGGSSGPGSPGSDGSEKTGVKLAQSSDYACAVVVALAAFSAARASFVTRPAATILPSFAKAS